MECPRCGQGKWDLVFRDMEVLEDDGKGTQKCVGTLVALRCHYCGIEVRKDEENLLTYTPKEELLNG